MVPQKWGCSRIPLDYLMPLTWWVSFLFSTNSPLYVCPNLPWLKIWLLCSFPRRLSLFSMSSTPPTPDTPFSSFKPLGKPQRSTLSILLPEHHKDAQHSTLSPIPPWASQRCTAIHNGTNGAHLKPLNTQQYLLMEAAETVSNRAGPWASMNWWNTQQRGPTTNLCLWISKCKFLLSFCGLQAYPIMCQSVLVTGYKA